MGKYFEIYRSWYVPGLFAVLASGAACSSSGARSEADWPPTAKRWYDRASASFRQGDLEDAQAALDSALRSAPERTESRILAARVALARLEYARAEELVKGIDGAEAAAIRGRALWYAGDIRRAADELERLIADPDVRDSWAVEISKLARRGEGRKPFEMSGGQVAVTEMPHAGTSSLIVPLELNGEPALGLIATGTPEAVIDASRGSEPSWVSLRFGERLEVQDVPALAKDLSGISRQVNAPIKILLGTNLLRRLHATFDFPGGQFVARQFEPPPPPHATALHVAYVRGGGMLVRAGLGRSDTAASCSLLVDTSVLYPVALDDEGWKKAGVAPNALRAVPNSGGLRQGIVPSLRLGAFEMSQVPGLQGDGVVREREAGLDMDLDGLMGAALLGTFRVTVADAGRTLWLEDVPRGAPARAPAEAAPPQAPAPAAAPEGPPAATPGSEPPRGLSAPPAQGVTPKPGPKPAGAGAPPAVPPAGTTPVPSAAPPKSPAGKP